MWDCCEDRMRLLSIFHGLFLPYRLDIFQTFYVCLFKRPGLPFWSIDERSNLLFLNSSDRGGHTSVPCFPFPSQWIHFGSDKTRERYSTFETFEPFTFLQVPSLTAANQSKSPVTLKSPPIRMAVYV